MLILFNPPSSANRKPILPMSLLALGAVLEGRHDYVIIDGNLEPDPLASVDRAVRERGATVLGVTVMPGPQLNFAVPFCHQVRERHPGLVIVWGGYFPTQHYEVCLAAPFVDYVVRGHAEIAFREVVDALAAGRDPSGIAGLVYRGEGGATVCNGMPAIPNPGELPDYPYDRVDVARYVRPTFMGKRTLPHHSSYGCPFFCNFCAVVNMVNGRWLAQPAERTIAIARRLVNEWHLDALEFYDNNFFVHEARTVAFAEGIRDLDIAWWGEARIDTLLNYSDESWRTLRESGLRMVFLGAESGSDATLERMNKGGSASAEKTIELAAKMRDLGIVPEFSFVLGNPPDPEEDVHQTIAFVRRLKRVHPGAEIIFYMYTPVPLAGELYDEAKAEGFAFPESLEEWISPQWQEFSQRRNNHVPWLSDPLRREIRDFERVLNAYYPTVTDRSLTPARRFVSRSLASWRYKLGVYRFPAELAALNRLISYQRPETSGF